MSIELLQKITEVLTRIETKVDRLDDRTTRIEEQLNDNIQHDELTQWGRGIQ
jgi:predicted RNA-binding protein with PIN domain